MQREGEIRFSVIVPVENAGRELPLCLKSVVEQPGPADWECILVDNSADEVCASLCDAFAAECPGVVALHPQSRGTAAACNAGIAAARGEWLLFLESRDAWVPDLLEPLRALLDQNPGFDWYAARCAPLDSPDSAPPAGFVAGALEGGRYADRTARLYKTVGWTVEGFCLRRRFLQDCGLSFWPEVVWGWELPFCLLLLLHCHRLYFADFVMTLRRQCPPDNRDPAALPRHFAGILAAEQGFARLFARGECLPAERTEILHRLADAFWPQVRAAARGDRALRAACAPWIGRCRELYAFGRERRWLRLLLRRFGPRFALWAAGLFLR